VAQGTRGEQRRARKQLNSADIDAPRNISRGYGDTMADDKLTYTEVLAQNTAVMKRLLEHLQACPEENGKLERELEYTNTNIAELKETVERNNDEIRVACDGFNACLTELKQIIARGEQWRKDHEALHSNVLNPKLSDLSGQLNVWKGINTGLSALFATIAGLISSARQ